MKNILCFGDSNTWGFKPNSFNFETMLGARYEWNERWPGILQSLLGNDYHVVEEGLNGRATQYDHPTKPVGNGVKELPLCLESHYPLDLVIITLGTNDTKLPFIQTPEQITKGLLKCVKLVKSTNRGRSGKAPKILIIAPQPICEKADNPFSFDFDETSIEKSKALAKLYQQLAKEEKVAFLDAGLYIQASQDDALHFDALMHQKMAEAVAAKVKKIFSA